MSLQLQFTHFYPRTVVFQLKFLQPSVKFSPITSSFKRLVDISFFKSAKKIKIDRFIVEFPWFSLFNIILTFNVLSDF